MSAIGWCGLGLVLLCFEMLTGTLYLLWLGIAALVMAMFSHFFAEMPIALQALNYAILSGLVLILMRKYERRKPGLSIGQSQGDEVGRQGVVIVSISPERPGKIRFSQGVLGSREWTAYADSPIAENQSARVLAVEGNVLRVEPV